MTNIQWYPDHDTEIVIMRNYLETYWEGWKWKKKWIK